jgi:hypothetical protein
MSTVIHKKKQFSLFIFNCVPLNEQFYQVVHFLFCLPLWNQQLCSPCLHSQGLIIFNCVLLNQQIFPNVLILRLFWNTPLDLEWKLLNVITLGQTETDFHNQMVLISKLASSYIRQEKVIWVLSIWMTLITLTN